jgi:hypothetical protein
MVGWVATLPPAAREVSQKGGFVTPRSQRKLSSFPLKLAALTAIVFAYSPSSVSLYSSEYRHG